MSRRLENTGYLAFGLSGLCAISSGIIVSILRDRWGLGYGMTGTLLSLMSMGNMAASFAAGILPGKIGARKTVALLCAGYFLGYMLMAFTGSAALLMAAFLAVGIAKGCTINNCTVLVGSNAADRTRGITLMHAFYATGAMACPFIISLLAGNAIVGIALAGLLLWLAFVSAGLPEREAGDKGKADFSFVRDPFFWLLTGLIFCQNAGETAVTGWLVTYYKDAHILSGALSTYTVTIMWGATLIARLLIAFVIKVRNTFGFLAVMGGGCCIFYLLLMMSSSPVPAVLMLFGFAFSMAGVNPVGMASIGKYMNPTGVGVLIPIAAIGQIVGPWSIGVIAEHVSLRSGMFFNLIPCAGIMVLSLYIKHALKGGYYEKT